MFTLLLLSVCLWGSPQLTGGQGGQKGGDTLNLIVKWWEVNMGAVWLTGQLQTSVQTNNLHAVLTKIFIVQKVMPALLFRLNCCRSTRNKPTCESGLEKFRLCLAGLSSRSVFWHKLIGHIFWNISSQTMSEFDPFCAECLIPNCPDSPPDHQIFCCCSHCSSWQVCAVSTS